MGQLDAIETAKRIMRIQFGLEPHSKHLFSPVVVPALADALLKEVDRIADLERRLSEVRLASYDRKSEPSKRIAHLERQLAESETESNIRQGYLNQAFEELDELRPQATRMREALENVRRHVTAKGRTKREWIRSQREMIQKVEEALAGDSGRGAKIQDEMLAWIEDACKYIKTMCTQGSVRDYPVWGKEMLQKAKPWIEGRTETEKDESQRR